MSHITFVSVVCALLVPQLGSPSFRQRERATADLHNLMPMSLPYLEAAEQSSDLETSIRATELVQHYYFSTAAYKASHAAPTGYPCIPWVDQLPDRYPGRQEVIHYYLSRAHHQMGSKGPPAWEDYRLATKLLVQDLYCHRASASHVQQLLDQMRDHEIEWIRRNGSRYNPPLVIPRGKR